VRKGDGVRFDSEHLEGAGAEAPADVTVRFSGRSGPVSGTVSPGDGEPAPFHGWLELMDELERIRGPLDLQQPA
jgi:hypothetical protein